MRDSPWMFDRMVLASGNKGKLAELRALLPAHIQLLGPAEVGLPEDLPEDGDGFEANAMQKASFAYAACGITCLADDSGLEVDALAGAPGVRSARYAGPGKDAMANMGLLLENMRCKADRHARFRTVLALVGPQGDRVFEGVVKGNITLVPRGSGGFGYDPIFEPLGYELTFAEMDAVTKNAISHRGRAVRALLGHIQGAGEGT